MVYAALLQFPHVTFWGIDWSPEEIWLIILAMLLVVMVPVTFWI